MKRKYRLISFDLDDTLLRNDKTIPKETIDWIRQYREDGGIVVLASGRDITEITDYMHQLGMDRGRKGYIISSSGAYLWDLEEDQVVEFPSFSSHEARVITEALLRQNEVVQPMIVCKKMDYIITLKPTIIDKLRFSYYRIRGNTRTLITPSEVEKIIDHIEKVRAEISHGTDYDKCISEVPEAHYRVIEGHRVDFFHNGVDKSAGVRVAIQKEGISPDEVLIFGDDENDITCFENFVNSVAMGNAVQQIKELARFQTCSNEHNGVLRFLIENNV